jgi:soluble lytic murein transglycosylase-like protein
MASSTPGYDPSRPRTRVPHQADRRPEQPRVVLEARRAKVPVSLLCAFLTQESGFKNVFGHDAVRNPIKGGPVTKARYLAYKRYRDQGLGMQGVGPGQLTWVGFQDQADKLGGCWKPKHNIRVAAGLIGSLLRAHPGNEHAAIARYNGTGPAAEHYADSVLRLQKVWHERLS